MGSSKKHKKDREVSSRRRSRSRSRSRSEEQRERKKNKKHREKDKERRHRSRRSEEREKSYHSDSKSTSSRSKIYILMKFSLLGSDVVEIISIPEAPVISKPPKERQRAKSKSLSPIPTDGAGDVLSIEATNKLRAKLGLKPLEVGTSEVAQPKKDEKEEKDESVSDLKKIKDDWGEFYHKPAGVFNEKTEVELLREKIASKREKRKIEDKLARIKTLGESDSADEDADAWVNKNRKIEEEKKQAKKRAKMLDDQDEDLEEAVTVRRRPVSKMPATSSRYGEKDLKGLKVAHNIETFKEDRQVILTLQDQDVLGEDGDTLVNVNMIENERYQKNVEVRKQNPLHYGYDVYEDQYDEFGTFIGRGMLSKYDEVLDGDTRKAFTIGESRELIQQQQRKALEVAAKLQNKTLESLNTEPLRIASDHFTEEELTTFKKPKRKVKKIRQKLKADDIIELAGGDQTDEKKDFGSRNKTDKVEKKKVVLNEEMLPPPPTEENTKIEPEDEDLEHMLNKARRLKQKEGIIRKDVSMNDIKSEVKMEVTSDEEEAGGGIIYQGGAYITLNQTAEFCRTLGDIPTYGMAGNRDETTDMMDVDQNDAEDEVVERGRGKWNQVDPNDEPKLLEGVPPAPENEDVAAILDEEPDVASGVANALKLAMSKGYLEKDDSNRPSNSKLSHLQAQNYSIDDKNHGEDDKYNRRGGGGHQHFNGPTSDFREKPGYHPNVKLEYIDDNNQKLTPKEAFRYLSHKFHGKGPGKNKIEKRLKKVEQEGVSSPLSIVFQKYFNLLFHSS